MTVDDVKQRYSWLQNYEEMTADQVGALRELAGSQLRRAAGDRYNPRSVTIAMFDMYGFVQRVRAPEGFYVDTQVVFATQAGGRSLITDPSGWARGLGMTLPAELSLL